MDVCEEAGCMCLDSEGVVGERGGLFYTRANLCACMINPCVWARQEGGGSKSKADLFTAQI